MREEPLYYVGVTLLAALAIALFMGIFFFPDVILHFIVIVSESLIILMPFVLIGLVIGEILISIKDRQYRAELSEPSEPMRQIWAPYRTYAIVIAGIIGLAPMFSNLGMNAVLLPEAMTYLTDPWQRSAMLNERNNALRKWGHVVVMDDWSCTDEFHDYRRYEYCNANGIYFWWPFQSDDS